MNITINELKTMKSKQLKRIIHECITEIMNEDATADKVAQDAKKVAVDKEIIALNKKKQELSKAPVSTLAEDEIDEMARIAKGFRLADPNIDATPYANKKVSRVSLESIINFFRENPGAEKTALQSEFNFVRPQIANAVVNALLSSGVLVKLGRGGEVEEPIPPGERAPQQAQDPEDMFMGNAANPLSMYFDNEPNNDGSEDFTDDEEPSEDEIERNDIQAPSISDEDYEAWMRFDDLKNRLEATKGNILKRKKGNVAGDIGDNSSTELERLRALKISLEDRINNLVTQSPYLQNKVEKQAIAESKKMDDYTIKQLQYRAGIIK